MCLAPQRRQSLLQLPSPLLLAAGAPPDSVTSTTFPAGAPAASVTSTTLAAGVLAGSVTSTTLDGKVDGGPRDLRGRSFPVRAMLGR